ncbi:MAG: acetyl-CoA hydrolase/transferase C-terminal domain-containing protein [Chloroflexota bacterium]|nr:acetyl-CoA hydrolase/transferase C-terminal domain-containing protein [Chloroflexota bacterium]
MTDWQDDYKKKLVSAEEAVGHVKSGDRVFFTAGRQTQALGLALAARVGEVKGVRVLVPTPDRDFGWYDRGWEESFEITIGFGMPIVWEMMAERRCDMAVGGLTGLEATDIDIDVVLVEVSPPDEHGFCSFGQSVWNKKEQVTAATLVLAEVNSRLIRTYGTNHVHVSEIDYFVEHTPSEKLPGRADLRGKAVSGPREEVKAIAGYLATLLRDGDTIEIGVGTTTEPLPQLGIFDGKVDLGWHSEHTPGKIVELIREGVFTGRYKTINRGKAVATAVGGSRQDLEWVQMNPMFELHSVNYVNDVRTIASHDNMVAINNALTIDLTGQITAESIGPRMLGGTGGQLSFAIGAAFSRGGRAVTLLPSTAKEGTISRIVAMLEQGTAITVPRSLADYIITEHGIACLRGKSQRQRAAEMMAVAHPDFRADLKREAQKLYWP